jgi:Zn2+/Cd2+-exporting ATPase
VSGQSVWIGRPSSAVDHIDPDARSDFNAQVEAMYRQGKALSALVIDGRGHLLVFEDTLRENAAETLRRLRVGGANRLVMLTGDHEVVARTIADALGIDEVCADLLPEDKLSLARELREKHGTLVMVGDGVNDAPALALADVGIAVGSIGADVAMEASDIVLMTDNLGSVAWLHEHAKRTARIVRQNIAIAVGVIVLLSGFAVTGHIPLPLAVVGHEGSTVFVALNALRLLRSPRV